MSSVPARLARHRLRRAVAAGLPREVAVAVESLLGADAPVTNGAARERLEALRTELATRPTADAEWEAHVASVPREIGTFLEALAAGLGARTIIELGTGVGMSAAYLASAPSCETLCTADNNPGRVAVARRILRPFGAVSVLELPFEDALSQALGTMESVDLLYVDGERREAELVEYVERVAERLSRSGAVVVDDIRRDRGTWAAWKRLRASEWTWWEIDLGRQGVLLRGGGDNRSLRLAWATGPWPLRGLVDRRVKLPRRIGLARARKHARRSGVIPWRQ